MVKNLERNGEGFGVGGELSTAARRPSSGGEEEMNCSRCPLFHPLDGLQMSCWAVSFDEPLSRA